MKLRTNPALFAALLLCALFGSASLTRAQRQHVERVDVEKAQIESQSPFQRDPFAFLSHALSAAGAPALTTAEEIQLTTLITAYRNSLPTGPDTALENARTAFNAALIAGDLTTANAQATIIANRTAALTNAQLQAEATFVTGVIAVLKTNGQFTLLSQYLGNGRLLDIIESLAGSPLGGGRRAVVVGID